jgi:hypothetical protein
MPHEKSVERDLRRAWRAAPRRRRATGPDPGRLAGRAVLAGWSALVVALLAGGALLEMATRHVWVGRAVIAVGALMLALELWRWGTGRARRR